MNLLLFFPFGLLTFCRTNISLWKHLYWHIFPLTLCGHTYINNWFIPFDHGNINSNFQFGILFFLFKYFLPHRTISSYMSFTTKKTFYSILSKSIILVITMLIIWVILIFLTITSLVLTIWSWIILLISKSIIWCIILL